MRKGKQDRMDGNMSYVFDPQINFRRLYDFGRPRSDRRQALQRPQLIYSMIVYQTGGEDIEPSWIVVCSKQLKRYGFKLSARSHESHKKS